MQHSVWMGHLNFFKKFELCAKIISDRPSRQKARK